MMSTNPIQINSKLVVSFRDITIIRQLKKNGWSPSSLKGDNK